MPAEPSLPDDALLSLLDTAPVMIWMSGPDARCNYFNRGWLAYTGRPLVDELGDGWAKGVHGDDLERCYATYMDAFRRREPFRMEYRLRRADGEYGWILDDGAPRYAKDGAFLGFIGSCVDITEQKAAERVLRSQTVTKELARRLINDLIGRARLPVAAVREFGRSLAPREAKPSIETCTEAFDAMGFGSISLRASDGKRFEFAGIDLLERVSGSSTPECHLTLGYLEGAVGAITGRKALGSEMSCQSTGAHECRFVVIAQ